ncbi:MAG: hypothetical protein CV045_02855 [Cyanobacteria bacterium M5B4]|nr:MAG: hypothetical protein CV045_02855 [Cyanobacteria bacterium M5B4]
MVLDARLKFQGINQSNELIFVGKDPYSTNIVVKVSAKSIKPMSSTPLLSSIVEELDSGEEFLVPEVVGTDSVPDCPLQRVVIFSV